MNIYESQPELENNKTKTKKLMIIIGVAIVILFVLSIGLIFYISYIEKNKFAMFFWKKLFFQWLLGIMGVDV